jgi:phosphatidylethanolamine/phosphatidyl-N-methylethanolamine N-methyltransferase
MKPHQQPGPGRPGKSGAPAAWIFFRQWLKNPLSIAAFSPSGRQLTKQMIAELPPHAARIVELGGGTGVFTRAMIEHGIAPRDLLVLELNDEFYAHLCEQFPEAHVVHGNAIDLEAIARRDGFLAAGLADAAISGLGLLSMSRETQRSILAAAFSVLKPNGRLIQFTYGPASPVPRELLTTMGLQVRRGGFAWRNVPPASVYVYSRNRSEAIRAQRAG